MTRGSLTFYTEATRQQHDDDQHDQDGPEPWILANAIFHVVDFVCGKWRVGVDPREEDRGLGVAVEEGHFGLGTRDCCLSWVLGEVESAGGWKEGYGEVQSNDGGYIAGCTVWKPSRKGDCGLVMGV